MKNKDMNKTKSKDTNRDPANPDPITGEPGAHPVGTGVGAAAGGATGAAIGAIGGPVGAAIGLVAGSVAGGLAGKAAGESVNPTIEDAYWRENHSTQPYGKGRPYDEYAGAYRTGYEGYSKYGGTGRSFEASEPALRADYERNRGHSRMSWDEAKPASRAAWQRASARTGGSNSAEECGCAPEAHVEETGTSRFNTKEDARNRQQTGRYEPKERGKP
jgi:hypothetical protein